MTNAARSPSADAFARAPLPKRFCNLDRLIHAMKARGLDGIVATAPWNVGPASRTTWSSPAPM